MREITGKQDSGESQESQVELTRQVVDFLHNVFGNDIELPDQPEDVFDFAHRIVESYVTDYKGTSPKWREARRMRADLGHRYIDGDPLEDLREAGEVVDLQLRTLQRDLREKVRPEQR